MTEIESIRNKIDIMVILNEGLQQGKSIVQVKSLAFDLPLFNIDLAGNRINSICSHHDFESAMDAFRIKIGDSDLARELPTAEDLRSAFQNALVIPPSNMSDFVHLLKEIEEKNSACLNYSKQSCLAIDTNIAYRRILTRTALERDSYGLNKVNFSKIQVLVPKAAKKEASNHITRKFSERDMSFLENRFRPAKNPFASFKNCTYLRGRKAQNAVVEFGAIRSHYPVIDIANKKWSEDKEVRDIEMLEDLEEYQRDNNLEVTFLTADDKNEAHLEAHALKGLVLKYPMEVPPTIQTNYWSVVELIYELSLIMGPISLKGLGTTVSSDWAGKSHNQYQLEMMKWFVDDRSPMAEALKRDLAIIDEMRKVADFHAI